MRLAAYLRELSRGRTILWCYLIWYLYFAARYFDPSPALWFSSLGISAIVGFALMLNAASAGQKPASWSLYRLFLMPFCVSSFSALIKGHGFFLIFSPDPVENAVALAICAAFCLSASLLRPRKN